MSQRITASLTIEAAYGGYIITEHLSRPTHASPIGTITMSTQHVCKTPDELWALVKLKLKIQDPPGNAETDAKEWR